ncbi:OmpA family protein, partial [bacterium]|nr:OmpA family protein [bacterium]
MKKATLILLLVACLAATGCTAVQRGAAVGAGAGALTGGIWAAHGGVLTSAQGAAVGLGAGGLGGALVGDIWNVVDEDEEYAARYRNLQQEYDAQKNLLQSEKGRTRGLQSDVSDLERQLKEQQAKSQAGTRDLSVRIAEYTIASRVLFKPGSAELSKEGKKSLDELAGTLKKDYPDQAINVEGHTDNQPIKSTAYKWKDNWELGTARALSVLRYLVHQHNFTPGKFSATTYGEHHPVAPNATKDGQEKNRRA